MQVSPIFGNTYCDGILSSSYTLLKGTLSSGNINLKHLKSKTHSRKPTMAEATTKKIAIITGSTRAVRVGPQVAKFVTEVLEANLSETTNKAVKFSLFQVDIATFKLPVFDEAVIPATVPMFAQFEHEHSKAWSAEIAKYDGYVWTTFPRCSFKF
jgi:hypothetical protein